VVGERYDVVMFERTEPRILLWWLVAAAILYLVLPFDLIPDLIGLPGRIDDLAAIVVLVLFYRNHVKQHRQAHPEQGDGRRFTGAGAGGQSSSGPERPGSKRGEQPFDAYKVLSVPRSASHETIHTAYRERMKEYHPDKVAHLGEELQQLAHEKSQQIQRAYREIKGGR